MLDEGERPSLQSRKKVEIFEFY